jgi:hypothetical protein
MTHLARRNEKKEENPRLEQFQNLLQVEIFGLRVRKFYIYS